MTITCQADGTWSGLSEEPRECEAVCGENLTPPSIASKYNDWLQNPDDEPHFDCTNGDKFGSVCTIICPPGFQQWTSNKYGPTSQTECKKQQGDHVWKNNWKITECSPIGMEGH